MCVLSLNIASSLYLSRYKSNMTAVFVNFSFQDSYACNFLGLAPAVEIPSHILSSDLFVLVDIVSPQGQVSILQAFI